MRKRPRSHLKDRPYCDILVYKGGIFLKRISRKIIWKGGYLVRYEKMWQKCKAIPNVIGIYRLDLP